MQLKSQVHFKQQRNAQKKFRQDHMQFCNYGALKCAIFNLGVGFQDPTI